MKETGFLRRRKAFRTRLTRLGPAPGEWHDFALPPGAAEVRYRSAGMELRAFLQRPDREEGARSPVVVFFHGGCAVSEEHFARTVPFLDAGFVVYSPMMRGENGNPGSYELFLGEVDDARAAIRWLHEQPFVRSDRIYAFGFSMGGEISAILSLFPDAPVRLTASCGPFFPRTDRFGVESMFGAPLPFDPADPDELAMRTLAGHFDDMVIPHYAFIGTEDEKFSDRAYRGMVGAGDLLTIIEVPGDHDGSVRHAVEECLKILREDGLKSLGEG